ncbi:MAG: IS200/IS605 family transposase [Bacteroidia bacterium]|nr:IS200/IS605 family transposase [Bacteroidia bacterium]
MPNTYSQIYIQIVFAVKNREALIHANWEAQLQKYITGIVQKKGQILMAVNGMPDHIHILISMKPTYCLSDLVREVKKSSATYINANDFSKFAFSWQEGYGAFSYAKWDVEKIVAYIRNQKEHHKKKSFREEYLGFLKDFQIEHNEKYLFEWHDETELYDPSGVG